MAISELIDRYCEIWGEPADDRRVAELAEIWEDGASYSDPSVETVGAAALLSHIAAARARWPGLRIRRTGDVDRHHDVARFAWEARQGDGQVLVEGLDIVILTDGARKIERVIGFFHALDSTVPPV